jgi:hypothetical protein
LIVSIHIPKTAGSSFRQLLADAYGDDLCLRYGQTPLRHRTDDTPIPPVSIEGDQRCTAVHGHFVADRVRLPPGVEPRYVVWLRHPVERLISHYLFWRRQPYLDQPLCRRLLDEDLSVEAFAAEPAMRDLQSFFLGALPLERFAFVGITERFADGVARFNERFGLNLRAPPLLNTNPERGDHGYRSLVGTRAYARITALNRRDMTLYETALGTWT